METNERRAYSYQVRDARGTSLDCEQLMTERVKVLPIWASDAGRELTLDSWELTGR